MKASKLILTSSLVFIGLAFWGISFAQNSQTPQAGSKHQDIAASDLGLKDPVLLPDSPFYFLKEWARDIESFFTFGQLNKTELAQKFASERLVELQKLVDSGKANSEVIKKVTEKYEETMGKIKEEADNIKEKASDNEDVNKFLQNFADQQVLHEKILDNLEGQVPEQALEKIKEAREQHLESFKEVMTKLEENQNEVAKKIREALKKEGENNSEILDRIKEKMPDDIKKQLDEIKEKNDSEETDNEEGGQKVCTQEYEPVCGADNKTYSNKCTAESAGATIAYEGECDHEKVCATDSDCPTIYCIKAPCPTNKCVEGKCKLVEL